MGIRRFYLPFWWHDTNRKDLVFLSWSWTQEQGLDTISNLPILIRLFYIVKKKRIIISIFNRCALRFEKWF